MTVSVNECRRAWRAAAPLLDVFSSDDQALVSFVKNASKDDLTVFTTVHGLRSELALFDAILSHPDLDRSTALSIFHACNPAFYEGELSNGTAEANLALDEEDAIVIAILDRAHQRITNGPEMTATFAAPCLNEWKKFPHVSPLYFKRWPLCQVVLSETEGLTPEPSVEYEDTQIRLSFDVWKRRH